MKEKAKFWLHLLLIEMHLENYLKGNLYLLPIPC